MYVNGFYCIKEFIYSKTQKTRTTIINSYYYSNSVSNGCITFSRKTSIVIYLKTICHLPNVVLRRYTQFLMISDANSGR